MKKHIITIAGKNGSGKSTTGNILAKMLNYDRFSTGDFMRKMAENQGVSLEELGQLAKNDPKIDKTIDENNIKLAKSDNLVIDSRLAFYFIPNSFRVFLELDPKIAATRILNDKNRKNESISELQNEEEITKSNEKRLESERNRYKKYYNIEDHTEHSNFDLVIDTSNISAEKVAEIIFDEYQKWINQ